MNSKNLPGGLPKARSGICGLDHLLEGGLPHGRPTLVLGSAGSGKTVLALQMMQNVVRQGEPAIFATFSESSARLLANHEGFGWDLDRLVTRGLTLIEADLCAGPLGGPDVAGVLANLQAAATESRAKWVVLDSFHLLLALVEDRLAEWQQVCRLREWLDCSGLTALITADLQGSGRETSQHLTFLNSISDCVVRLDFQPGVSSGSRHVQVVKYRGSSFIEGLHPLTIGAAGIEILFPQPDAEQSASQEGLTPEIQAARQDLNARVQALDRLLEIKQAELNFLLEKKAHKPEKQDPRHGGRPGQRPGKRNGRGRL